MKRINRVATSRFLLVSVGLVALFVAHRAVVASDHADAPAVAGDQAADLGDTYMFLDPNDNSKIVMAQTFRGFIVPGEAVNFTSFDQNVLYRFQIENTGDAKPDLSIDVQFTARTATNAAQTAKIMLPAFGKQKKRTFFAPSTLATQAGTAPAPTITTDPISGISFFAGEVDDPFFFDIPAFSRFVASVNAGAPNASVFARGRDTFAGYNILSIVLSVPADLVRGKSTNTVVGLNAISMRRTQSASKNGGFTATGPFRQVDRSGNPGTNVVLIPFNRKDEYNASTTMDDARGKFKDSIIATLTKFGTDAAHIGTLASVAVTNGDFLRVNLNTTNSGPQGGTNSGAGFPNGRRPSDDVIDTILTIVANGTTLGDGVPANDVLFRDQFPFFAAPHQPQVPGTIDDDTRN